jgi:MFS superfamily sulfate permease-like transporter
LLIIILASVLQIIASGLRLAIQMRCISRSVITGFVNALTILNFRGTAASAHRSMMTAAIVDELTETPSDKNRECIGQGQLNLHQPSGGCYTSPHSWQALQSSCHL